jgi:hypothetical protein
MNKSALLDYAEVFDAWRVVPRLLLFGYAWWLVVIVDALLSWYMRLPIAAQTVQASGFCFGAITSVTTVGGYVYRIYANTGRDWDSTSSIRTTAVSETIQK